MDMYLESKIPFAVNIQGLPEEMKQAIYCYIRDNVSRNMPEYDEETNYFGCKYMGVRCNSLGTTSLYFHNSSRGFGPSPISDVTVFTFREFLEHLRSMSSVTPSTTKNTNQETTTMDTTQPSLSDRIIENLPTDIYHFRRFKDDKKLNTGGMTVIVKLVGNKLVVGATVCGINQTFDRKEGIRQASDRFEMIEGTYEKLPTKYEMLEVMKKAKTQNTVRMYRLFSRMVG